MIYSSLYSIDDINDAIADLQKGENLQKAHIILRHALNDNKDNYNLFSASLMCEQKLFGKNKAYHFANYFVEENNLHTPDYLFAITTTVPDEGVDGKKSVDILTDYFEKILRLDPDHVETLTNYANSHSRRGNYDISDKLFARVLALGPSESIIYRNYIQSFIDRGDLKTAKDQYEKIRPKFSSGRDYTHLGALIKLRTGDWREGMGEYVKYVKHLHKAYSDMLGAKKWQNDGDPTTEKGDKTLALLGLTGIGDSIQFLRYAHKVRQIFKGKLWAVVPDELIKICEKMQIFDEIFPLLGPLQRCDYYADLMELPSLFDNQEYYQPPHNPYLYNNKERLKYWQHKLNELDENNNFRLGFLWTGNPKNKENNNRSMTIDDLKILSQLKHTKLFNLQVGDYDKNDLNILGDYIDLAPHLTDFQETAAVITTLDAVVTIETSVAHLAGALSLENTYVLLAKNPCWRWGRHSPTHPLYPSLKLYRQDVKGDWQSPLSAICAHISLHATGKYLAKSVHMKG